MSNVLGRAANSLSDAEHLNVIVRALLNVINVDDDTDTVIRATEVRWGASDRRIYRDGSGNLTIQDPVSGTKTMATLVASATAPAVPPYLGNIDPSSQATPTANRLYLLPVVLKVNATFTGVRIYVITQAGNMIGGLYDSGGNKLAETVSTAVGAGSAFQTVAFSVNYSAAPGLYYTGVVFNNAGAAISSALVRKPVIAKYYDVGSFSMPATATIPATTATAVSQPVGLAVLSGGIF